MLNSVEEILESVLPANYWLSKSMEFSKIQTSGTLWYLKKWLVYYQFVFLNSSHNINDYQQVSDCFQTFIMSLPQNLQVEATNFFFQIDIRQNFTSLNNFLNTTQNFANENERKNFVNQGKRFYFMYLMNIGGQAGYKARIKNLIAEGKNFEEILLIIRDEMSADGKTPAQIEGLIADFPAPIRNERQIFFYYGIFHGRENADLSGFYNLTSIGKAILRANFYELLVIWEHQKLKMVSQSPVADIQQIPANVDFDKFGIHSQPYFTLLSVLKKKGEITKDQYKYVISKVKNKTDLETVAENILGNEAIENQFRQRAESFGRKGDVSEEDFAKELKKFILGVCNLPKDQYQNPFACVSWLENSKISITNQAKFDFLWQNYQVFSQNLLQKNEYLYQSFEDELKAVYASQRNLSDGVKYDWFKYIINFDIDLLFHLVYVCISLKTGKLNYSLAKQEIDEGFEIFKNLCQIFKIRKTEFRKINANIQDNLANSEFYNYSETLGEQIYKPISVENLQSDVLLQRLRNESQNVSLEFNLTRTRNDNLIRLIRSYYLHFRNHENLTPCDACGQTTFLTNNEIPYLEFHHIIPFSTDFGPDHYLNLLGICPLCHRKFHYAQTVEKQSRYKFASANNNLKVSLRGRMNELFIQRILEPIHLDFLKKEKIISNEDYEILMSNQPLNLNE